MKTILLAQGIETLVDDDDYEHLSAQKWYFCKTGYAYNSKGNLMHRTILGLKSGEYCDHINGNKLDNRKNNLRKATATQSSENRPRHRDNKSGRKGVSWDNARGKWRCQIGYNRKSIYLGLCSSIEEASEIYRNKAKELYGDFAYNEIIRE